MTEDSTAAWRVQCGRCKRIAPPADTSPEGQVVQGWVSYESQQVAIIDVPAEGGVLPVEVVEAIRDLDDHVLVGLDPDPQIKAARPRELASSYLGVVCPQCQQETGWDYTQWSLFFTEPGHGDGEAA